MKQETLEGNKYFQYGMPVILLEDCIINGRKRARKGEIGNVATMHCEDKEELRVRFKGHYYPINQVPIKIITEYFKPPDTHQPK